MKCPKCGQDIEGTNLEMALIEELYNVDENLRHIAHQLENGDFSSKIHKISKELNKSIREKQKELIEEQEV